MRKNVWRLLAIALLVIGIIPLTHYASHYIMPSGDMDEMRMNFISLGDEIQQNLLPTGKYKCCLKNPCTLCIEKDPNHGEGATCDCLADLVEGHPPCGECIGEILTGNGNPYLKEYFATAIAEEVGEQYLEILQGIIDEKYEA